MNNILKRTTILTLDEKVEEAKIIISDLSKKFNHFEKRNDILEIAILLNKQSSNYLISLNDHNCNEE